MKMKTNFLYEKLKVFSATYLFPETYTVILSRL